MDQHVRQFGILTIVMSVVGLIGGVLIVAVPGMSDFLVRQTGWDEARLIAIGLGAYNLLLAIPSLIAAPALLKYQEWARNVLIVTSALNVLNVPFGPLLGAYGLWILFSPETDPLFAEPRNSQEGTPGNRGKGMFGKRFTTPPQDEKTNRVLHSKADLHP